jgi:hypothetical protein
VRGEKYFGGTGLQAGRGGGASCVSRGRADQAEDLGDAENGDNRAQEKPRKIITGCPKLKRRGS